MINFNTFYSEASGNITNTILSCDPNSTIFELKANLIAILDLDFNDIKILLENYGLLDNEDSLEIPLNLLGIEADKTYSIFIHNIKNPQNIWKLFCTEKIIGKNCITQQGFIINNHNKNIPICLGCKMFCRSNHEIKEIILENNFFCMCGDIKNNSKCLFDNGHNYESEKEIILKNINSIINHHSNELYLREKLKIEEVNKDHLLRDFDFKRSTKFGLQRVNQYEEEKIKEKVMSVIPIDKLKKEAEINSIKTNLHFRDELVKSLLSWFNKQFFSWCDKPKCINCNKSSDVYLESQTPNEEERSWLASRTEIYKCSSCNNLCRFPRFNNPVKLCETKTGRCGEWANLFGCILRSLNYDVRFIDNFEDHVWNEYYSESLKRWVHIDSCENAWDTPLIYEQGWGRNMTFILGHSVHGVYDVTRRYVKDWSLIMSRRSQREIDNLNKSLEIENNLLREKVNPELIEALYERDLREQMELLKVKDAKEAEMIGRQSGSKDWRMERGELK